MNLKFKKIYATLAVGLLSALSFTPTLNTEAGLTAPTSWTFKYTNQDFPGFKLRSQTAVISTPTYVRTADSTYWNYTSTFTITTGLTATQTFNRSNSTWAFDSASGNYIPSAAAIGSDGTVGTIFDKIRITFSNQTNKDYKFYLDISSSGAGRPFRLLYDNVTFGYSNLYQTTVHSSFTTFIIPSYSTILLRSEFDSSSIYFDAWYLQDLGVSDAYTNGYNNGYTEGETDGYDAGFNDGYNDGYDEGFITGQNEADLLVTGFSAMVGILVNFVLMIVNLEVFGVSIMGIFAIIVLFTGIVWFLKLIRG